jgi:hypothetical protein
MFRRNVLPPNKVGIRFPDYAAIETHTIIMERTISLDVTPLCLVETTDVSEACPACVFKVKK